jgi:hypothetical protein
MVDCDRHCNTTRLDVKTYTLCNPSTLTALVQTQMYFCSFVYGCCWSSRITETPVDQAADRAYRTAQKASFGAEKAVLNAVAAVPAVV